MNGLRPVLAYLAWNKPMPAWLFLREAISFAEESDDSY